MEWPQETLFSLFFSENITALSLKKMENDYIVMPIFIRMETKVFAICSICSNGKIILIIFTMM